MKSHYVSQFVIRRFSNAINIFNIKTGKIDEEKKTGKIFYKQDIYDEEIEKLVNFNIESRVANIVDKKILVSGDVVLTREELNILKKYMLICSVRTLTEDYFCKLLKNFKKKANSYLNIRKEYAFLKGTEDLGITNNELYLRALKVYAASNTIQEIAFNPLATREILAWALPFLESYIAFWDAPENQEYVLTDSGMCSEYEGFHMITGGLDISKISYLLNQIDNEKIQYSTLLASNIIMYENYNIFNLSSKRCMIAINPFFKLYNNHKLIVKSEDDVMASMEKPDIWPAIIQNKELFNIPETHYSHSLEPFSPYAQDDEFVYAPKVLTNEDLVYINNLMLTQSNEIIGFNNPQNIIDSIYYHIWHDSNFKSVKRGNQSIQEIINSLVENVVNSPFHQLCKFAEEKGGNGKVEFLFLFEKIVNNIYKDFYENPYICEYYLKMPEETARCKELDFLGDGYLKLDAFRKILSNIKEKKKSEDIK